MYDEYNDWDGGYDEFNDWDATECANGDYNTFEERMVASDMSLERADDELSHWRGWLLENGYPSVAVDAYYEDTGGLEDFENAFLGLYEGDTEADAVGEWQRQMDEDVLTTSPEFYRAYIDWNRIGRDLIRDGQVFSAPGPNGLYILFRHV